jgi:SnoaL-like domain
MTGGGKVIATQMHANNSSGFYWTLHYMISPVITLAPDNNSADVFCYLWELATSHPDKGRKAFWIGGDYTAKMVRDKGSWKIHRLNLNLKLLSPYAEGWSGPITTFDEV